MASRVYGQEGVDISLTFVPREVGGVRCQASALLFFPDPFRGWTCQPSLSSRSSFFRWVQTIFRWVQSSFFHVLVERERA